MMNSYTELKKISLKTDELESRILLCERKLKSQNSRQKLRFKTENAIMNFEQIENNIPIKCGFETGCSVEINISSESQNFVTCQAFWNEKEVKVFDGNYPIKFSIPVITKVGENLLKIIVCDKSGGVGYSLNFDVLVKGIVDNRLIEPRIAYVGDTLFAYFSGSSATVIEGDTMQTVFFESGNLDYCLSTCQGDYVAVLSKNNDSVNINLYGYYSPTLYRSLEYKIKCSDICFDYVSGEFIFYIIKGNNVYQAYTKNLELSSEEQLPIKAKKVKFCRFGLGAYLLYLDLNDCWWLVELEDSESYVEKEKISLGKLDGIHLYEYFGDIAFSYKNGDVIMEKLLSNLKEERILCDGDEAFRIKIGDIIVRKEDKFYKIKE